MVKNYPDLKNLVPLFFFLFSIAAFSQNPTIYPTPGTFTFTVPAGVTTIKVEAWGAGAAGNKGTNKGGGGGAFAGRNAITVTPGDTYTVIVGQEGAAFGRDSSFGILVKAAGAIGENGGTVPGSIGTIKYAGGNGGTGISDPNGGAGGGGSAGAGGMGGVGGNTSGNSGGGTAGGAGFPGFGSAGAAGGIGGNGTSVNGSNGAFPGGGGGEGGKNSGTSNGIGGNGQVKISWIIVSVASNPITVCSGANVNLTASATPSNPRGVLIAEGFNNPTNNWTTINTSTGGIPANATWSLRPNNHQVQLSKNPVWNYLYTFNSNDASQFYLSDSDSQGPVGPGQSTQTILTSPAISTLGYSTLSLEFYHYYEFYTGSSAKVEVSTDGTNWTAIASYTTTQGSFSAFAYTTINLGAAYLGVPSLKIRFNYQASYGYWWAIDNVIVSGNRTNYDYSWSASPSGTAGLPASAGTPSTTNASITANPTITTIYAATASTGDGLIGQSSTTVTVNPLPAAPTTTNAFICTGSSATLAASGAIATQFYKWYDVATLGNLLKTSANDTDNTFATIALTSTTDYWVAIVNSNGCESVRTKATAFVNVKNIWNGSVDKDWNKAGNWCIGVPTIGVDNTLDVIIPSGLTNYPIIYAGAVSGYVKTIVLENNTKLNVRENSLWISHYLKLNGVIDLEGESQLVQKRYGVYDSNPPYNFITTQLSESEFDAASTGTIEIDQQGTGDSFNYNYWSSPVNSNITAKTYSIGAVLKDGTNPIYKEITFGAGHTWAEGDIGSSPIRLSTYWMYKLENSRGYAAWTRIGDNISIKAGEGYTMKGSNTTTTEQNYIFVGKPNNGDISLPIAKDNDYLVGNPYPSALDAWQFIEDNLAHTGPLYFWEHSGGGTHNLSGYQGGYATYSQAGGLPASYYQPVAGVGTNEFANKVPGPYIPVGQAFFVVGEKEGDIIFKNSQRIFVKESQVDPITKNPYSVFMKSSSTKVKTADKDLSDLRPKFRIGFDAPKISHRQLLLTIDERATPAFDRGYEAEIYEVFLDDFYWMLDGKRYVIQATNNVGLNSEVPIGIQLSKTGVVTVKIDALENVNDDTSIYLKDKVTGESFNMREKPVQLNLVAGKYADRFVLIFKTQKMVEEDVKAEMLIPAAAQPIIEGIHVFMNNAMGELQIKNNSTEEIVSVALINALGQTVKTWNSNFNIRTISLPINTATGVYLVQINTKTGKTVKKISVE